MKRLASLWVLWALGCYQRLEFDTSPAVSAAGTSTSAGAGGSAGQAGATSSGGARPCARDSDCGLASLHCDGSSGLCFECVTGADCPTPSASRCDAALHRCVQCSVDQDCQAGFVCNLTLRQCAQTCAEDFPCPGAARSCDDTMRICVECEGEEDDCALDATRPYCLVPGNRCAACRRDQDCAAGQFCDSLTGTCLGCRDSRDCPASQACDPARHLCVAP